MLHVKKIIEKFRKQTEEDIEITTITTLQQWCSQAVELQVVRADKANQDIKGPGFWKLDKANVEAVQENLKADFQGVAITHHEEIPDLLTKQWECVKNIAQEALTVAESIPVMAAHGEENILHILDMMRRIRRNPAKLLYIVDNFSHLSSCRFVPCGALSHGRAIGVSQTAHVVCT